MSNEISDILVVGYGSIGKRHVNNLIKMKYHPVVLTKYPEKNNKIHFIDNLNHCNDINYCVIATPTADHYKDLKNVVDCTACKNYLLEKPVECSLEKAREIYNLARKNKLNIHVAYDMRFINVFAKIKEVISDEIDKIRLVKIVAGQYLPEWRPSRDYRSSYSAKQVMGGGVQLDLSHEIDYMLWLFGRPSKTLFTFKNKISSLEIDSFDYFKGLYEYPGFIVDVELDYFRKLERSLRFIGENDELLFLDFIDHKMVLRGEEFKEEKLFNKDTYIEELKEFLNIKPQEKLCTLSDGIKVLEVIQ